MKHINVGVNIDTRLSHFMGWKCLNMLSVLNQPWKGGTNADIDSLSPSPSGGQQSDLNSEKKYLRYSTVRDKKVLILF